MARSLRSLREEGASCPCPRRTGEEAEAGAAGGQLLGGRRPLLEVVVPPGAAWGLRAPQCWAGGRPRIVPAPAQRVCPSLLPAGLLGGWLEGMSGKLPS